MNTLELIVKHGLSVRQIPLSVRETRSLLRDSAITPGWEFLEIEVSPKFAAMYEKRAQLPQLRKDAEGRIFRPWETRLRIPANAGYWMAKKVSSTSSQVVWSTVDNLAPTLPESVALWMLKQPAPSDVPEPNGYPQQPL